MKALRVSSLTIAMFALAVAGSVFFGGEAAAQLISSVDNPSAVASVTGSESSFRSIVLTITNFVLSFLGLIAVLMIIYGGFIYVTSQGNQEKVDTAKKIITYAAIGIVVILVSFALVYTLLGAASPNSSQS